MPLHLVEAYGKREITKALGTSDFGEAKKRVVLEWALLDREFEEKSAVPSAVPMEADLVGSKSDAAIDEVRSGRARIGFASIIRRMQSELEELTPAGAARAPSASGGTRRSVTRQSSAKELSWDELVGRWAIERKPQPNTRKAHAAVANDFFVRSGVTPASVIQADVLKFKQALLAEGITNANINTKLSRLRTIINFGHENGWVAEKAADKVKVPSPKFKARVPFDDQALQQLFGGPVHQHGERPAQGRGEAAFWMPLIAIYTGARLEEIAGLLVIDLVELDYRLENGEDAKHWFFRFSPDPGRGRTLKNDSSERIVPIHPELIRLGLIRYAQALPDPQGQLFPRLTPHASGKRAHKWGQWFGQYLRSACGVADKRQVYHSFRHTLKDAARECDVSEELQRAIMGHAPTGVAGGYGLGFSRRKVIEGMARIKIPGLPEICPIP